MERATPAPQFIICGTEKAVEQARILGHAPEKIFRTSGMILRPKFYQTVTLDRAQERRRLGLDTDRPTGLVLFGGQGSKVMLEIAQRLQDTQLILICGHNRELAARLKGMPAKAPHFVEGFTSEIPYYMHLADFFLGKPGPGSVSEAMATKLPVILERNAWTLPQERYNAEWVIERNTGIVLRNFRQVADAVERMLGNLAGFRENVEKIQNRAVFEIPEIFERILN
jgi:UDP-N-acetylglucosamine:LPS N-acetylglucosamine transferase